MTPSPFTPALIEPLHTHTFPIVGESTFTPSSPTAAQRRRDVRRKALMASGASSNVVHSGTQASRNKAAYGRRK